ncbi:hypothetical protein ACSSS7_004078 [Eimeria intestinalis]
MAEGQNLEDQENEMEALAALLPHEGEFTQLSPTSCIVRMVPFGERGRKDPLNRVMVGMRFEFTPDYPQELPIWSFEDSEPALEEEESEGSPSTPPADESRGPGERALCAASERCTKQEFESWAAAFRTEMEERGIWKGSCAKGVVTGRQLFMEDGLGIAAAADEDGIDEPARAAFWSQPSLFGQDAKDLPSDD